MAQTRVKAAYNTAKSFLITRFIKENARVLDIGCGSEILKFEPHFPDYVIQVHTTDCSLEFANSKNIKYEYGVHIANVFIDQLSESTTTVQKIGAPIPRRLRLVGVDLVTSFSVLESCPDLQSLHHLCKQVHDLLVPGGSWIGCITNSARLMERCDETGHYQDNYCEVHMDAQAQAYWFATHQRHQKQYMWSLLDISRIAKEYGLILCLQESLLDLLGNAMPSEHYSRIRHSSQLNGKLKLHLDDFRTLSLLTFFCFLKPTA